MSTEQADKEARLTKPPQITIRTMLIVMAVAAALLGWARSLDYYFPSMIYSVASGIGCLLLGATIAAVLRKYSFLRAFLSAGFLAAVAPLLMCSLARGYRTHVIAATIAAIWAPWLFLALKLKTYGQLVQVALGLTWGAAVVNLVMASFWRSDMSRGWVFTVVITLVPIGMFAVAVPLWTVRRTLHTRLGRHVVFAAASVTVVLLTFGVIRWLSPPQGSRTVTPGRATTFLTGPLDEHGLVDYIAAVNQQWGKGVTPQNNAAVLITRAMGPKELFDRETPEVRKEVLSRLGIGDLPDEGDYFEDWGPFLESCFRRQSGLTEEEFYAAIGTRYSRFEWDADEPWRRDDYPAVAEWLKANRNSLALFEEAARRPRYYLPVVSTWESDYLYRYHQDAFRIALEGFKTRALMLCGAAEFEAAWRDAQTMYRLCRLRGETELWPAHGYWGWTWRRDKDASRIVIEIARLGELDRTRAVEMIATLEELPELPTARAAIDRGYRLHDLVVASDLVRRGKASCWAEYITYEDERADPDYVDADVLLRRINEDYDQLAAALNAPSHWQRQWRLGQAAQAEYEMYEEEARFDESLWGQFAFAIGSPTAKSKRISLRISRCIILPAWHGPYLVDVEMEHCHSVAWHRLARISLALAAYHADKGAYPASLDKLVPDCLSGVPDDPFSDRPMVYRPSGGGYVLYSVGGNMTDDGGAWQDDLVVEVD